MSDVFNIQSTVLQGIWPTTRLSTEDASEKEAVMGSGREPCNKRHGIRKMILSFAIEFFFAHTRLFRFWAYFGMWFQLVGDLSSLVSAKHITFHLRQRGDGKVIYHSIKLEMRILSTSGLQMLQVQLAAMQLYKCLQSIAPRGAHQLLIPPSLCGENCCVQGTCNFHCSFSCTLCLLQGWLSCARIKPQNNAHRIRNIMSWIMKHQYKIYTYFYSKSMVMTHKHTAKIGLSIW